MSIGKSGKKEKREGKREEMKRKDDLLCHDYLYRHELLFSMVMTISILIDHESRREDGYDAAKPDSVQVQVSNRKIKNHYDHDHDVFSYFLLKEVRVKIDIYIYRLYMCVCVLNLLRGLGSGSWEDGRVGNLGNSSVG